MPDSDAEKLGEYVFGVLSSLAGNMRKAYRSSDSGFFSGHLAKGIPGSVKFL